MPKMGVKKTEPYGSALILCIKIILSDQNFQGISSYNPP
ncbi:MAG: hypothetical protein JWO44_1119 [Bacteroidetes bacterium]|nr:hypothetical protein [Bacteroidota bacterium]